MRADGCQTLITPGRMIGGSDSRPSIRCASPPAKSAGAHVYQPPRCPRSSPYRSDRRPAGHAVREPIICDQAARPHPKSRGRRRSGADASCVRSKLVLDLGAPGAMGGPRTPCCCTYVFGIHSRPSSLPSPCASPWRLGAMRSCEAVRMSLSCAALDGGGASWRR